MKKLSKNTHLTKEDIIKNGSFFTPDNIVKIVYDMVTPYIKESSIIMDFGSGYGTFLNQFNKLNNVIIGTEIDDKSYELLTNLFNNRVYLENSLINVGRKKYNIKSSDDLIIIGNPPYNDVTSQYRKGNKGVIVCDKDLEARDIGMSFLKCYNKLKANYICILHPLSYLIKKQNFRLLGDFTKNYKLIDAVIFSSKEFESIRKTNSEFPVIAALYKRTAKGSEYEDIRNFNFKILNSSKTFCLNEILTIDGIVPKYPSKDKQTKLQFWTQRDMNSLLRNTTFVKGPVNNGINVTLDNLYQYAWLYYLKNNFKPKHNKFLYGNLSPLYFKEIDNIEYKNALVSYVYNDCPLIKEYYNINDIETIYGPLEVNYDLLEEKLQELYIFE